MLLVKPQTYMNVRASAAGACCASTESPPEQLIVVHDDVDLAVGRRPHPQPAGGAGGNHGVESCIEALGDPGFVRVKVGVGRPPAGPVPPDWVLGVPPAEEAARSAPAEGVATEAIELRARAKGRAAP